MGAWGASGLSSILSTPTMVEVTDEFQKNKATLDLKRNFRAGGFHVPEMGEREFIDGLMKLYPPNPDIPKLQGELLKDIKERNPNFSAEHPLISEPLTKEGLKEKYINRQDLIKREGSLDKVVDNASRYLRTWLMHVKYYIVDSPNPEYLDESVKEAEKIIDGRWNLDESEHPTS